MTVGLAGAFFWVLEARKEWSKIDREQPERQEVISSSKDEPPKKPERRMSLEAMKAAEEMRREAAAATAAASVGVVKEPEIQSPQRDARSSVSVERRLRQGASLSRLDLIINYLSNTVVEILQRRSRSNSRSRSKGGSRCFSISGTSNIP